MLPSNGPLVARRPSNSDPEKLRAQLRALHSGVPKFMTFASSQQVKRFRAITTRAKKIVDSRRLDNLEAEASALTRDFDRLARELGGQ